MRSIDEANKCRVGRETSMGEISILMRWEQVTSNYSPDPALLQPRDRSQGVEEMRGLSSCKMVVSRQSSVDWAGLSVVCNDARSRPICLGL